MPQTPLHDWLRPRLQSLLADAVAAGFAPEAAAAVLVDLVTAQPYSAAPQPMPRTLPPR